MPNKWEEQLGIPIHIMPNGDTAGARGAAIEALKLTHDKAARDPHPAGRPSSARGATILAIRLTSGHVVGTRQALESRMTLFHPIRLSLPCIDRFLSRFAVSGGVRKLAPAVFSATGPGRETLRRAPAKAGGEPPHFTSTKGRHYSCCPPEPCVS